MLYLTGGRDLSVKEGFTCGCVKIRYLPVRHLDQASKGVEVAFAPVLDRLRPFSASNDLFILTKV